MMGPQDRVQLPKKVAEFSGLWIFMVDITSLDVQTNIHITGVGLPNTSATRLESPPSDFFYELLVEAGTCCTSVLRTRA